MVLDHLGSRRVLLIAALGAAVIIGAFAAQNLASSTVYYLTPSEARDRKIPAGQTARLGGQIEFVRLRFQFVRQYNGDVFGNSRGNVVAKKCSQIVLGGAMCVFSANEPRTRIGDFHFAAQHVEPGHHARLETTGGVLQFLGQ